MDWRWIGGRMNVWLDELIDGWMNCWMVGWIDEWLDDE
jgi:hypothetical protein